MKQITPRGAHIPGTPLGSANDNDHFTNPPTKLCEGNVFSSVSLLTWGEDVSKVTVSHDPLHQTRGGSRILRRRGCQPSREGAPTYYFAKFSEKMHEIKKILDRRGGRAPGAPPLRSATADYTPAPHLPCPAFFPLGTPTNPSLLPHFPPLIFKSCCTPCYLRVVCSF